MKVSAPQVLNGGVATVVAFPFNALLLTFGTEAAAAYHLSRRVQQQVMAPFRRALTTVASIMVGQSLGGGDSEKGVREGYGLVYLTWSIVGLLGALLFAFAPQALRLFNRDPQTVNFAVEFLRTLVVGMFFFSLYTVLAGALRGGGDTRYPFYATVVGSVVFMLGLSYLLAVPLGWGVGGILAGLFTSYLSRAAIVFWRFRDRGWIEEAKVMIAERDRQRGS